MILTYASQPSKTIYANNSLMIGWIEWDVLLLLRKANSSLSLIYIINITQKHTKLISGILKSYGVLISRRH